MSNITIKPFDFDDNLLDRMIQSRETVLSVYQFPHTAVVLGRASKSEIELKVGNCISDSLSLYRRKGGGCSVVLDPGNIIVSVVLYNNKIGQITRYFKNLSKWLIQGLEKSGIEKVQQQGISDLTIGGRKIGGSCLYQTRSLVYYSCSLLVQADVQLMDRYLKHPPREPVYRHNRKHSDFVISLNTIYPHLTVKNLIAQLEMKLGSDMLH